MHAPALPRYSKCWALGSLHHLAMIIVAEINSLVVRLLCIFAVMSLGSSFRNGIAGLQGRCRVDWLDSATFPNTELILVCIPVTTCNI